MRMLPLALLPKTRFLVIDTVYRLRKCGFTRGDMSQRAGSGVSKPLVMLSPVPLFCVCGSKCELSASSPASFGFMLYGGVLS